MSVRRLILRDFVIVQALDLDLAPGFTVLTGETGAGKSILIDALQLALGSRADANVVREGASRADICAEFDVPAHVLGWLDAAGFNADEGLLLRRSVDAQGKSRAWINGTPATAGQLRELGSQLLDIHGQHAWQSLMQPQSVRALLDEYAGVSLAPLLKAWQTWQAAQEAVQRAQADQGRNQIERERLAWQIAEVAKLAPGTEEWPELNSQHARLSHAQALTDAVTQTLAELVDNDINVTASLSRGVQVLRDKLEWAPEFQPIVDVLVSSLTQAEDAAHSLNAWLRHTELDPDRLATLDQRLSAWMSLARRYRSPPGELATLYHSWQDQLQHLDAAANLDQLIQTEQTARDVWQKEAHLVSEARQRAAPKLSRAITQAMQELGMQGGQFKVQFDPLKTPSAHGQEDVIFLVAGHAGSTPKPVGKVASGGELSRIALAIAVTTSQLGHAGTLIFDEVDSGVGGAVAETVGRLMKKLGQDRQVLAVTHLPQVAAHADHHLVVAKQRIKSQTHSTVQTVVDETRVAELARMLGGEQISATTHAHAKELLATAVQRDKVN